MYFLYDLVRLGVLALASGLIWHLMIIRILIRYDKSTSQRFTTVGIKLVNILPKAGPAFTKLGQFLSTRPDLLNKELCRELGTLRDMVSPVPFSHMLGTLQRVYDKDIVNLLQIDHDVVASASISQVYKAEWQGEKIALKILRPKVRKEFSANLRLMKYAAFAITKVFDNSKRLRLSEIVKVIEQSAEIELDLMMEAAAADRIGENAVKRNDVYVPKIIWELCNSEILAMEWIDGKSIVSIGGDEIGAAHINDETRAELASKLAIAFFHQAYDDGFFHADWHGGNILLMDDGKVALLDYGIVCFLPEDDKIFIASILHAFLQRDYDRVAVLHWQAGYIPDTASIEIFALACRSIAEPIIGKESDSISMSSLLKRLFMVTGKFNMETQPQLLLLQKNMIMLEGTIYSIYPKANLWKILEPWLEEWAKKNLSILSTILRKGKKLYDLISIRNNNWK